MVAVAAHLDIADAPAALVQMPARRAVGLRLVGMTTLGAAVAIAVLAGLAVFHSWLAAGQYRLSELESEIAVERERLLDLRYELQTLHGPAEIELMGVGALGLIDASDPIDVRIEASPHRRGGCTSRDHTRRRELAVDQDAADRRVHSA